VVLVLFAQVYGAAAHRDGLVVAAAQSREQPR